jgi:hypothetical protein
MSYICEEYNMSYNIENVNNVEERMDICYIDICTNVSEDFTIL